MKKPQKPRYPKKPTLPKGGIKTEAQLKAYEDKLKKWKAVCAEKRKKYDAEMKKYEAFRKKVERLKNQARDIRY